MKNIFFFFNLAEIRVYVRIIIFRSPVYLALLFSVTFPIPPPLKNKSGRYFATNRWQ
jgi:hypothetical protein